MDNKDQDLSILNRFEFERQPIGVKYYFKKPVGINQIAKNLTLCEMLKEAQLADSPFYVAQENQSCKPGSYVWGDDVLGAYESGLFGQEMKIFKEARANVRLKQHIPKLDRSIVKYIAFAPIDKINFTPDLLIILTDNTSQSEILLRAMTYATGEVWSSKTTCVMGCAWLLAYPHVTGKVNYFITGFGTGMKAKKLFPEGRQILSIPYDWLPIITKSLSEMPWSIPAWETDDIGTFIKELQSRLDA
jgi:uncharacterized protein (DUF169 family)